jgi:hypothetical protein
LVLDLINRSMNLLDTHEFEHPDYTSPWEYRTTGILPVAVVLCRALGSSLRSH